MKNILAILTLATTLLIGCEKESDTVQTINTITKDTLVIKDTVFIEQTVTTPQIPDVTKPISIVANREVIWVDPTVHDIAAPSFSINYNTDFIDGKSNSSQLSNSGFAPATLCENSSAHGFSDWYLPSIGELQEIDNNSGVIFTTFPAVSEINRIFLSSTTVTISGTIYSSIWNLTQKSYPWTNYNSIANSNNTYKVMCVRKD